MLLPLPLGSALSVLPCVQYEVSGEEHLYSDFPEIDLSQLDAGDLDSAGCFSELQWGGEHSETDSSQYSTDDSELFQIIDSENEALLAALTETLDDIQGDDMGLAAFRTMEEGDTLNSATTSPAPSPKPTAPVTGGPPPAPECDELSLVEGPRDRRASVPQAQSRSCTELHRHLTSSTSCSHTKAPPAPEECPGSGHHPSPGGCAHHEDDSDSSEDSLSSGDSVAALSPAEDGTGSQFCEGELHSVVELIRYMHTYCLPPRKLPPDTDCAPAPGSAQSRPGCAWQAAGGCKKPGASFSILKELLARDLLCDVSKPYRLGRPVYAGLARPPGSCSPAQDSAVFAVRRSKRLNPELGHWLSFLDQPRPEDQVAPSLQAAAKAGGFTCGQCFLSFPLGFGAVVHLNSPDFLLFSSDPAFGKRNFEPMLTVELCGTAGLTPPTTPPYKPAEEDLYKPDIPQEPGKEDGMSLSPGGAGDVAASQKAPRKHPERTELFAHLSRAGGRALPEQQGLLKRPFSRSFGDHDYCQVLKPEAALQRKALKSWDGARRPGCALCWAASPTHSPKSSPTHSPKPSPKLSPNPSPKLSPNSSPTHSPNPSPKCREAGGHSTHTGPPPSTLSHS
uniref:PPARG coactivator 1 beta n=1 Tax=Cyanistes caeruleus TaxID=156563 RepID=A0A8C0VER6_CYACU